MLTTRSFGLRLLVRSVCGVIVDVSDGVTTHGGEGGEREALVQGQTAHKVMYDAGTTRPRAEELPPLAGV